MNGGIRIPVPRGLTKRERQSSRYSCIRESLTRKIHRYSILCNVELTDVSDSSQFYFRYTGEIQKTRSISETSYIRIYACAYASLGHLSQMRTMRDEKMSNLESFDETGPEPEHYILPGKRKEYERGMTYARERERRKANYRERWSERKGEPRGPVTRMNI